MDMGGKLHGFPPISSFQTYARGVPQLAAEVSFRCWGISVTETLRLPAGDALHATAALHGTSMACPCSVAGR
jgi:hypothetical protein